jgi:hypothetical protein
MKKIIFTKAIFILLLLSSMVWSGYRYEAAIMQSCGGSITTSNAYFNITSTTSYTRSDYFTNGTKPDEYVFMLQSNNSSISLRAITEDTHTFAGWKVVSGASNCSFTDASKASTTLKIKGKCAIKANRKLTALTLNAGTGGSVSSESNCTIGISVYEEKISNRYNEGRETPYAEILKATPSAGYRFDKWTITSGSSNCAIANSSKAQTGASIKGSCTIKGTFVKTAVLTISKNSGGSISPSGSKTVDVGSKVNISATPDNSYRFVNWTFSSGSDKCSIADKNSKSTSITVNGDCTIKANFKQTRTLTVTAGTGGSVSPTSKVVDNGGTWTITATPNSSYRFTGWSFVSGGSSCTLDDASATSTKVKVGGDCTVKASFVRTYTLKLSAGTGGSTNFTSKTVDAGSKVDISASINQYGYRFDKWTSSSTSCTIADPTSSSTKVTVNGVCTVTANF